MLHIFCTRRLFFVVAHFTLFTLYHPVSTKFWKNIYVQQNLNEFDYGPIGLEELELFALELGKIAAFDFVYSLASTNTNQSAPNLVTMNMSRDLR